MGTAVGTNIRLLSALTFLLTALCGSAGAMTLDKERGVYSLAPSLEPIMPAIVQILVERQPGAAQQRPHEDPRRGRPGPDPRFGGPEGFPDERSAPQRPRARQGTGSGVIGDSKRGLIMTNHHVVQQAQRIKVKLTDGRVADAETVGSDEATDIALLRIKLDALTAITVGDSEDLKVGDVVVAIGYPFGIDQTVTIGIVSGLGRKGIGKRFEDFIQTDAAINFGNSGGALVDTKGRLVGINTAIYSRSGGSVGIGFAVPVRMAVGVMEQLVAFGEVRRGRLGVEVQDLSVDIAKALAIKARKGALITRLHENSPGRDAGLQSGDVVVRAGDQNIDNSSDLRNVVGLSKPDAKIVLVVLRKNEKKTIAVQLGGSAQVASGQAHLAGARFSALTSDNPMSRFVQGVVVETVEAGSQAARRGLRTGDIVTHVNRKEVTEVSHMQAALERVGSVAALTVVRGNSEFIVVIKGA
ncbi:MAG: Do family serine endopeptidase [Pseudomonadota bacterium]